MAESWRVGLQGVRSTVCGHLEEAFVVSNTTAATRGPRRLEDARAELITRVEEAVAAHLRPAVQRYFELASPEDLVGREVRDLAALINSHVELGQGRPVGTARVQVLAPSVDRDGWHSSHTIVQVVTDDMPFLVDSVTSELTRQGRSIHLVMHPRYTVTRDGSANLKEIAARTSGAEGQTESWICVEIDRETDVEDLRAIEQQLLHVLQDVREAVEDWPQMRQRALELASHLRGDSVAGSGDQELSDAVDLLNWLVADHFTFIGYSEFDLTTDAGGQTLKNVAGTGLGVLRSDSHEGALFGDPHNAARILASDNQLLLVTKASTRSSVHRSDYLDYVALRRRDASGNVTGEYRFVGLFTAAAYTQSVNTIPVVSRKVADVVSTMGLGSNSHSGKDLLQFLETYPRDDLFQITTAELVDAARGALQLQERRQVRAFVRNDAFGRFASVLVYFPRDRYTTDVRLDMESILLDAYQAESVDHASRVTQSALARLHFVVHMPSTSQLPEIDVDDLEGRLAEATRMWEDDFAEALADAKGEEVAMQILRKWNDAFPESFKEDVSAEEAVRHLDVLESLENVAPGEIKVAMYTPANAADGTRRFAIYRLGQSITLSSVLPMLHDLGVEVIDERAYDIQIKGRDISWIYDFGLQFDDSATPAVDTLNERFCATFMASWHGAVDSDGFNALVLHGGLHPRNVAIIRAYAAYLRQAGTPFSQGYLQQVLLGHVDVVQLFVKLFAARFDPEFAQDRDAVSAELTMQINKALDAVASLDHDRILRSCVALVNATLRTNVYQRNESGTYTEVMAFKLDPTAVPELPLPLPKFEVWVFSPRVEGIHLRFASVARGGLRWSDRLEDFRTEILGLVKAQMVKNTVIVPSGAKGGFVVKKGPDASDRDAWLAEGIACYQAFIGALLDVTDNLSGDTVIPPERVVRHDMDDPYLVVAADKGTATFSDIANQISLDRGFWLGDAFASGGSIGYDHKAMGITARGAWESVKRHFLELGHNSQEQDFTAVGIGDMSGDVFGNGMLLSEHIRLVAAFDHRHIFLDPNPDSARSFKERERLFALPRSSWEDYDTSLISAGGGIHPRTAKSIDITPEVREALGLPDDVTSLKPYELQSHILKAPVDLLWNGGIGTYIKASTETHAQVGDKANDALRIDGNQVRARVIGEGGNLGLTQLGRIEASRSGVKLNTDAIDNSAGVDTSDHEVNIKILIDQAVASGALKPEERTAFLTAMTDEVGLLVLRDNYEQNLILEQARFQNAAMLRVHQRLIATLEQSGRLNRAVEYLPTDSVLDALHAQGAGLSSPELSVLMAYVKIDVSSDEGLKELTNEPWCQPILHGYFPQQMQDRFKDLMATHPLRSDIIATVLTNDMVNRGGITFVSRAAEETGAGFSEIVRAFVVSREVFGFQSIWDELEALDGKVSTDLQTKLFLEARRLLDRSTRWFLQSRGGRLDVEQEIAKFGPEIARLMPTIPGLLLGAEGERLNRHTNRYVDAGAPEALARKIASLLDVFSLLDIIEIAQKSDASSDSVAALYFAISERYDVDRLLVHITALPRDDRWSAHARSALRSDLYTAQAGLTSRVARATTGAGSISEQIETWEETFAEGVARTRSMLNEIAVSEQVDLATLSVALRALRTLVGQGAV